MRTSNSESGFSLVELMVASMVTLIVVGLALTTFNDSMALNESVTQLADSSQNLRAGTNMLVRDLLQTGRNIPTGGIAIPSGAGATGIHRPSPPNKDYFFNNTTQTTLSAITTGEALGATINGTATDLVTVIMDDAVRGELTVQPSTASGNVPKLAADGSSLSVATSLAWLDGDPSDGIPPIAKGDVLFFQGPTGNTLQVVTRINSPNIYFDSNDPFNLNQRGAAAGSITQIKGTTMNVRRILMWTYYVHQASGENPRMMRALNMYPPQALAGVIEDLSISFDLVDGVYNPANIKTLPYTANGLIYGANQIRKANLRVGVRAESKTAKQQDFIRNELSTVVSLRNLAYVDRYK